jgi:hypothetical protein
MSESRPTLSVCILARSSRGGLERLLDEIDDVADEIVIGVDAASTDDALALATRRADVVFRFEHTGPPVRARLLILEHARGDWILSLDEDEGLDAAFAPLLPELIDQSRYTHYWLSRKWIVVREPLTHVHAAPWFPDWQLRLFRRDPRRVWHPGIVHSGYRVMGLGCREHRTAILHYEAVTLGADERQAKIDYYREHGSEGRSDSAYGPMPEAARRETTPGPAVGDRSRAVARAGRLIPDVLPVAPVPATPPWGATLDVTMPSEAVARDEILVEVNVRNTGRLAWENGGSWPRLHLSFHLRRADGEVVRFDGDRFALPRVAEPGDAATFLFNLIAPPEAGDYVIEWDFVSEGECWFADCGSSTTRTALHVTV